ncbi:MAG: outer membrane beta-barrel protein [Fibrobacterota bacterium]
MLHRLLRISLALGITSLFAAQQSPFDRSGICLSGEYGFSERTVEVASAGKKATLAAGNVNTGGLTLGFIKALNPRYALRISGALGSGKEKGELQRNQLLSTSTGGYEYHDLRASYAHSYTGLYVDLLYKFHPGRRVFPFAFAGTGVTSYTVTKSFVIEDTTPYDGSSVPMENNAFDKTAFNASAGLGAVWMYGANIGLFAQYKFRYWKPVEFTEELVAGVSVSQMQTHFTHQFEGGLHFVF